jgi:hypothetical protein
MRKNISQKMFCLASNKLPKTIDDMDQGFATLEILIAMTILILVFSATILVSFGNQSLLTDSQTNREALDIAEGLLQTELGFARKDFKLAVPIAPATNGMYQTSVSVTMLDFFTKKVTATVIWQSDHNRPQQTQLSTLVTDFQNAVGGDTCDSTLSGDWTHPVIKNSVTDFGQLIGDTTNTYSISAVDAYQNRLYITAGNTSAPTNETLFIFNSTNPAHLTLLGKLDNAPTTSTGLSAVVVATSSQDNYAYVANENGANFSTCTSGKKCAQLQIIDITNPGSPSIKINYEIPTSTTPFVLGSSGQAVGNTLFYSNGYIYMGLTKTASGPEFNIIDVHNPLIPKWVGGYSVGYTINAIYVRGNYAYLVHTTDSTATTQEQMTVLDISNPTTPHRVSGYFYTAGIFNSGKSLYGVGDTLYLGRLASKISGANDTIPEFYSLNDGDPTTIPNSTLGTIPLNTPESLHGIIVRDYLAFLLTTHTFQIWNISNLANPLSTFSLTLPTSGGTITPSFDCEGNYFFIATNSTNNKGSLYVIAP